MSSDGFFNDDFDDSALIAEVDAVSAAYLAPATTPAPAPVRAPAPAPARARAPPPVSKFKPATTRPSRIPSPAAPPVVIEIPDSDDYDVSGMFDEADLLELDAAASTAYSRTASTSSAAPPVRSVVRTTSKSNVQLDLFGNPVNAAASSSRTVTTPGRPANGGASARQGNSFGGPQRKTKHWDHTAFAKSGWKFTKSKGKGKSRDADEEEDDEEEESRQLPAPFVPVGPLQPMKLQPDLLSIKHWIYPLNNERRDYQYNIVKHCLFENTLVALPTGLGKTFIAGVVMLNYYTWFPQGKVIFVAPTKPLVAQQVVASHKVCGIPGNDAVEMTGEIPAPTRERHWANKRVFYLTPQTLVNDLEKGRCDPQDIVLLVIDEAHKGTGDYAYAQVVRYLMATNPHFRVLALTATPGGTPEAVQALVDALHISRIEIRNEDSLDLKQYMHKKIMKQHTIQMNEDVLAVREHLVKLMEGPIQQVQRAGLLRGAEAIRLHPYRPQAAMGEVSKRADKGSLAWTYGVLKKLGGLARAMGYLMESSIGMCYTSLRELSDAGTSEKGSKLSKDPNFVKTMHELESRNRDGFPLHPKMVELKNLIIQHFGAQMSDPDAENPEGEGRGHGRGRVMVFAAFREVVEELVEMLNKERPLIRAIKLIGQSTDKQGNAGLNQKGQQEVLDKFKAGHGNVLVATSIGEEGLDIGEIDMVICYDAQKTPIRMLQRIGRTGRKSDGYVHILMAEGREEDNWNKSKAAYDEVQRAIVRAEQLELYADVPRLLPESAKPQPVEQVMEIVEYSRQNSRSTSMADGGAAPKRAPKRKRNDDIGRNAPEGTPKGFQSVGEMLRTQKGKSKVRKRKPDDPTVGTDDDTDRELEAGLFGPSRQKTPTEPEAGPSSTKKGRKRKSDTGEVKTNAKKKTSAKKGVKRKGVVIDPPTLSQRGQDDSDDQELMAGLNGSSKKPAKKRAPKRRRINGILQGVSSDDSEQDPSRVLKWHPRGQTPPRQATPPVDDDSDDLAAPARAHRMSPVHDNDVIDISSHNSRSRSVSPLVKPRISSPPRGDLELSPPRFSRSRSPTRTAPASAHDSPRASPVPDALPKADRRARSPAPVGKQASLSWLLSDDEAVDDDAAPEQHANSTVYDDAGLVDDDFLEINSSPPIPRQSTPSHTRLTHNTAPGMGSPSSPALSVPCASSPAQYVRVPSAQAMPPPRVPFRPLIATPETPGTPDASFPVARGGGARKRVLVDSSPAEASQPRLQRLQRERELEVEVPSSPLVQRAPTRRKRRRPNGAVLRAFVDDEAGHSGNEVSEGSSGDDDPESESDRRFLRAPPESQVPEGYAQTQVYRESMFTQAPSGQGPAFAARPVVRGKFGPIRTPKRVRGRGSSPVTELGSEPDEYDYGSFIVHDEEDIVYDEDSSQLQN